MKTTKASTNATTYGEYLERREKELQEEVELWHRAWKDTRAENAALKSRIADLEKLVNELEARKDRLRDEGFKLHDYALELEEQVELLESLLRHAREEAAFWQNEAEK